MISSRPELFNRLTETLVFRPLAQETQIEILKNMLARKLEHLEKMLGKGPLVVEPRVNAHLHLGFADSKTKLRQMRDFISLTA